jgi:hypothetical protein
MFGIQNWRIIHYPVVSGFGGYFYIRIWWYPESPDTEMFRIPVSPNPNISKFMQSTLNQYNTNHNIQLFIDYLDCFQPLYNGDPAAKALTHAFRHDQTGPIIAQAWLPLITIGKPAPSA